MQPSNKKGKRGQSRREKRNRLIAIVALIIVVVFIIGMIVEPLVSARADTLGDLQNKLGSLQNEQKDIKNRISQNKVKQADITSQKKEIDADVENIKQQIDVINEQITAYDSQIAEKQTEIDLTQKRIGQNYSTFKERIRALYKNGDLSYVEILLSSDSLSEFLSRVQTVKVISRHDEKLLSDLQNDKAKLESDKNAIQSDRDAEASSQSRLQSKKDELSAESSQSATLLNQLKEQQNDLQKQYDADAAAEAAANEEIEQYLSSHPSSGNYIGGDFLWPIQGMATTISSGFGMRLDPYSHVKKLHAGIDIIQAGGPNINGHAISAANYGKVGYAGWISGYGNTIIIDHGGGVETLYGHCSSLAVSSGQQVSKGQTIGHVGSTGDSTGPHLHFGIMVNVLSGVLINNNNFVNPLNYSYINRR